MINIHSVFFDDFIPDWSRPAERLNHHVLVLVLKGKVNYIIDDRHFMVNEGELLLIPEGSVRRSTNWGNELHQKYTVLFNCHTPQINSLYLKLPNYHYLKNRLAYLFGLWLSKEPFYELTTAGVLQELIGLCLCGRTKRKRLKGSPIQSLHAERMREYLIRNYRSKITCKELAGQISCSPNYAITLFKNELGQTPTQFLLQLRIAASLDLLAHTQMTVHQISEFLGFYDSSYFHKMFRKMQGLSPSEYRIKIQSYSPQPSIPTDRIYSVN